MDRTGSGGSGSPRRTNPPVLLPSLQCTPQPRHGGARVQPTLMEKSPSSKRSAGLPRGLQEKEEAADASDWRGPLHVEMRSQASAQGWLASCCAPRNTLAVEAGCPGHSRRRMFLHLNTGGGGGGDSAGPTLPGGGVGRQLPPPQGASGQQLVVKGMNPRSQWAP